MRVELQVGKIYPYYPQALKPVLTREKVGQIDARFSMAIEKYIKRDMITRIELDKDFIRDIGSIAQLGDLEFENEDYLDSINRRAHNVEKRLRPEFYRTFSIRYYYPMKRNLVNGQRIS